jgi:tRNA threonylcarbamoyladenosine biosynthesis protein TsaE
MSQSRTVFTVESPSTDTTLQLGEALGSILQAGDIVGLVGKLGAGKTWFAKGIAEGLNVPRHEYVNSPAYDIIHKYSGRFPVYHMDFYRIDQIGEEEYLWLDEYFEMDGVCIAEWADKFLSELTDSYLKVDIDWNVYTDVRRMTFVGVGDRYEDVIAQLRRKVDANS